ncbi:general secretion pathway protein GspJ [Caldichromatium japonicum]|uniref:general secretion pathway protein GspJ n=1 Tax=Caldichromatium japonicum TaxID=2699430 RepID=UPI001FE91D90|nr:general secretion pathway protein GspJ [Caldichromatium japonicum]
MIELIIALAIIGLIALLLFSGLRLGGRSWEAVDTASERFSALRLADGFVRRTLAQLRPASAPYDGQQVQVFAGEAGRIEWASPLSDQVGLPGLYILRLQQEGDNLVLTRWLLHPELLAAGEDVPAWVPLTEQDEAELAGLPVEIDRAGGAFGRTLLLSNVNRFNLAYYGWADGDSEPGWHETWVGQTHLPELLQIRLETNEQSWPEIILRLPDQS